MNNYLVKEKYKISYLCNACEKVTEHEFEEYLMGYGDDLDISYLSLCPSCDKYEEFKSMDQLKEKQGLKYYYLLDLERTVGLDEIYFWTKNKFGYVNDVMKAGEFNEIEAQRIVRDDRDKLTVSVETSIVKKILKLED
jgi:hypothetical protein